ncbi:MAG: hypothetical protein PHR98_04085 [Candidatus Shapirobacteria bacterium]|jgi:hypothetical protein|nr:hypothetical protein [Candidatus Shapirobacteria bacterium]
MEENLSPKVESKIYIDTDLGSVRILRGLNQFEAEKNIPNLFGKSVRERYFQIRKGIYGEFGNVKLDDIAKLVSDNTREWPNRELVKNLYLPNLYEFIDSENKRISDLKNPEERKEQGMRLAITNYMLGLMIHQAIDGNGQTQRVIALSYIHEHDEEKRNHFLPIKYDERSDKFLPQFIVKYENFKYCPIPDLTVEEKETLKLALEINNTDSETAKEETNESVLDYIKKFDELGIVLSVPESDFDMQEGKYFFVKKYLATRVLNILEEKYPGYFFPYISLPNDPGSVIKSSLLTTFLTTTEGKRCLGEFIMSGKMNIRDEKLGEKYFLEWAQNTLTNLQSQFENALNQEDEFKHLLKHEQYKAFSKRIITSVSIAHEFQSDEIIKTVNGSIRYQGHFELNPEKLGNLNSYPHEVHFFDVIPDGERKTGISAMVILVACRGGYQSFGHIIFNWNRDNATTALLNSNPIIEEGMLKIEDNLPSPIVESMKMGDEKEAVYGVYRMSNEIIETLMLTGMSRLRTMGFTRVEIPKDSPILESLGKKFTKKLLQKQRDGTYIINLDKIKKYNKYIEEIIKK